MNPKKPVLDKKIPTAFSVTQRVDIAFRETCSAIGLKASPTIEHLMQEFLKEHYLNQKK